MAKKKRKLSGAAKVMHQKGLPANISRMAKAIKRSNPSWSKKRAIATAISASKRRATTGDLNFPGKQKIKPSTRSKAIKATATWKRRMAEARRK